MIDHQIFQSISRPGLFRVTFTCLDEITIPKIFMAMVRPHLEYGNVIWHPSFQPDKAEIEKRKSPKESHKTNPKTHPVT